jgi:Retrotransposon gag protein
MDQPNDIPPAPPVVDPMAQLAAAMAQLADISTFSLANNLSKAKAVQKPTPFKGEQGSDARRFLAAFTMWATVQGTALNTVDQQGNAVDRRDVEWIRAALSYLQDEASIWGSPAMEEFANGVIPFDNDWDVFREQFKARFETVNETVDAKEKLRVLEQNESTVPEYAAQFKELMSRTGYSSTDLRDRFYEHLAPIIKDELVHTARPVDTLDRLISVTTDLDVRIRQRQAEKEREKKRTWFAKRTAVTQPLVSNTPFVSPSSTEPAAMDVDATRTRDEFLRRMKGRCLGCGSATHFKKDGSHDRDLCTYCKRAGHREVVCMDKFMGKPKSQKAAAVGIEGLSDNEEFPISEEEEGVAVAATSSPVLSQLLEQQEILAVKIAALRDQDF